MVNPESTVSPVTPIEIGEDALVNPESLPQENLPTGFAVDPVVDNPVVLVPESTFTIMFALDPPGVFNV